MTDDADDRCLVLLPGLDGTGDLFAPFLAALDAGVRTHVVSYPTDRVLSIAQLAELTIRTLPPGPLVLVAESFSGLVTLEVLARRTLPIEAAVLVAAFAEPPHRLLPWLRPLFPLAAPCLRWTPGFVLRWFCLGRQAGADSVRRLRRALRRVPPRVLAERLRQLAEPSPHARERFDVPCLYLRATGDRLVTPKAAERLAANFNSLQLEEVGGPHFLLQAEPGSCWRCIRRFLDPG